MITFANNILATIFYILFFSNIAFAQNVLLVEDFNNCSLPQGWSVEIEGNQNANWSIGVSQNPESEDSSIDGSCMFIIDDHLNGENAEPNIVRVRSANFNGTNYSTINFNLDVHFRHFEETSFSVYCFDGENYRLVRSYESGEGQTGEAMSDFQTLTADLSYYSNENMHLVFEYDDKDLWGWHAGFDNLRITGEGDFTNLYLNNFNDCDFGNFWRYSWLGDNAWQVGYSENGNTASNSMNGTCFAYFDDEILGEDTPYAGANLGVPAFDSRAYAEVWVEFDLIFRKANSYERFALNIWDGERVHTIQDFYEEVGGPEWSNWNTVRFDASGFRMDNMNIYFDYYDGDGWGWYVGIDNVKVQVKGSLNDACQRAMPIDINQACVVVNNQNALNEGIAPACSNGDMTNSLWYTFTTPTAGLYKISSESNYNDILTVLDGTCESMNQLVCKNRDEHGFVGEDLYLNAEAGKDYYLQVAGIESRFGKATGEVCIDIEAVNELPKEPTNTNCAGAIAIMQDADCATGSNKDAELSLGPNGSIWARHDIWFSFVAMSEDVEVLSNADFSDLITVYEGDCSGLGELAYTLEGKELNLYDLNVGSNYFIQIAGTFATIEGNVCVEVNNISIDTPDNDECADATDLNIGAGCQSVNLNNATFDGVSSTCILSSDGDAWFSFVAPPSRVVYLQTNGSVKHAVSVYKGTSCSVLEEFYCKKNIEICQDYHKIENLIEDKKYYIQIGMDEQANGAVEGDFCIELLDQEPDYSPLTMSVTVVCDGEGVGRLLIQTVGGAGQLNFIGNTENDILYTGDEFIIIVEDENGCQVSEFGTFDCGQIACQLTGEFEFENVSCNGGTDGSYSISLENAQEPVTYNWPSGFDGASATDLEAGSYQVTVTDANNCILFFDVDIEEPNPIQGTLETENESGFELSNGTASIEPIGGSGALQINWSNGATGSTVDNLAPGTYTVEVIDENNCSETYSFTIESYECDLAAQIETTDVLCFGDNSGVAGITLENVSGNASFEWSNGSDGQGADNLAAGAYSVVINDDNNCQTTLNFTIEQPEILQAALVSSVGISCHEETNGTASVTAQGGTAPYFYLWPGGETTQEVDQLSAGSYMVTVTDANLCDSQINIFMDQPEALELSSIIEEQVSCTGESDGIAMVNAQGGTAPFTYQWSNGASGAAANGLEAGEYTIEVIDANDCTAAINLSIEEPAALSLETLGQNEISCNAANDGNIIVSGFGGTEPYTFTWSNGVEQPNNTNLIAGNYSVIIMDANGCQETLEFELTQPTALMLDLSSINETSNQANDGQASLVIEGGIEPYEILWSNDETTKNINNLSPGDYQVTVVDANGCQDILSFVINSFTCANFETSDISQNITCAGDDDGAIEINISGGTEPYTYVWSNGMSNAILEDLEAGQYEVIITDADNCITVQTVTLTEPALLAANVSFIENVSCADANDGQVQIDVYGGTGTYTYEWSNGFDIAGSEDLPFGEYSVIISDENGCQTEVTFEIDQPAALTLDITGTDESAFEAMDGSVIVNPSAGTPPYQFIWSNGANTQNVNGLSPGEYNVTVTDANDCTETTSVFVGSFACDFEVTIDTRDISCFGIADGFVDIQTSGGVEPYDYNWSNGQIESSLNNLGAGYYTVTILDGNDCPAVVNFEIVEPSQLMLTSTASLDLTCIEEGSGQISIEPFGGSGNYDIIWSNGTTGSEVDNLGIGIYTVVVTDENGCEVQEQFEVTANDEEGPSINVNDITLRLNNAGEAYLEVEQVNNGTSDNCGLENMDLSHTVFTCEDLGENEITFTATDINDNVSTATVLVTVIDDIEPTIFCPQQIIVTSCGGYTEYNIPEATDNCSGDQVTIELISGLPSGSIFEPGITEISYSATDGSGNSATCTFEVIMVEPISLEASTTTTMCTGAANGTADISISGGTPGYEFEWNIGTHGQFADELAAGDYSVTVTDLNGCISVIEFTIEDAQEISILVAPTDVLCAGEENGTASVSVSGGTPEYFIRWSNGATGTDVGELPAGSYELTVTDLNGCEKIEYFDVIEPTELQFNVEEVIPSNASEANGEIQIEVQGGTPPYLYNWYTNGTLVSNEEDLEGVDAGFYIVEVFDANGCSIITTEIEVTELTSTLILEASESILLSPNPTNDLSFVDFTFIEAKTIQVQIFDLTGKLILETTPSFQVEGQIKIHAKQWAPATYQVLIKVDGKFVTKTLVVVE